MSKTNLKATSVPGDEPEFFDVGSLHLDARNPRLVEYGIAPQEAEDKILEILWDKMAVDEVAMSIAANGYWPYEPLIVTEEAGRTVVVEGNRRLAAVKVLNSKALQKKLRVPDLPEITTARKQELQSLPGIRVARREDAWRYLGFKHVNGPAKWRAYAKAQYIAFVHNSTGEKLAAIAAQIGDRHRTVQRLFRALMVIEQAERAGVYRRDFALRSQLAFSHLTTALEYDGFAKFLGLAEEADESITPVATDRMKELGEVCRWLWGDRRDDTEPLIRSQNPHLRQLDQVLRSEAAVATLRRGFGLEAAYDVSKGDDVVFTEALQEAKNALVVAQGRVSVGYRGERNLLETANTIAEMADDLVSVMEGKANTLRARRRRATGD
ncbi:MAG: ParB N-terminal domain-containing protein [Verrucomicrobiales bacterium]|nr:ParB N-terminal domain-containing protein [Verrucomicrobiales bacterium]MCP5525733.1 ParB N-terminal domain-containing protein [Verrucomicrobiales bacterium]